MNPAAQGGLGRRELIAIGVLWAVLVFCYVLVRRDAIAHMGMPDTDDYMRLQQVRDWLSGQSWFDLTQHRVNPPAGAAMHWSRLVDLPIALLIIILRPFVGQPTAEMLTSVIVPMATLAVIMLLVAAITSKLVDRVWAPIAAVAVALSGQIYTQIQPMRLDHHGWQVVAALVLLWALLDEARPRRSGAVAGAAGALWLTISVEGLPMVACAGAILGVRWLIDPRSLPRLQAYVWVLSGACLLLETVTTGFGWAGVECDQLSSPYMLAFAFASIGVAMAGLPFLSKDWRARVVAGVVIAALAGSAFLLRAPQCLAGPFASLEPLTRSLWLDNVAESLPLWRRGVGVLIANGSLAAFGCIGAAWALRSARDDESRMRWASVLVLCAAAGLLMLSLMRAGAVAQAFAIPGAIFIVRALKERAEAAANVWRRVIALSLIFAMITLPQAATALDRRPAGAFDSCDEDVVALNALAPGLIFAPLDIGPTIIVDTPHSVVATGHHRNHAAINDVISALTGSADFAHEKVSAHAARYVVLCASAADTVLYTQVAPHGFAAQLVAGRAPGWLERIDLAPAGSRIMVYRVRAERAS